MLLGIGLLLAIASIWFIGGKKKEYNLTTTINARPQQLFPYLVESELKKRWLTSIVNEELVASTADVEADREPVFEENREINSLININGETLEFKSQVIRYQQDQTLSIKSQNEDLVLTHFFRLKPKGNSTELVYRKIMKLNGLGRLLAVFEEDVNQAVLEQEVSRLAQIVESEVDNSAPLDDEFGSEESAESFAGEGS